MPPVVELTKKTDEAAKAEALASVINTALGTSGDVVKELLRTAAANPIVAAPTMVILIDILDKQGALSQNKLSVTINGASYSATIHDILIIWILGLSTLAEAGTILSGGVKTLSYGTADIATLLPLIAAL